MNVRSVAWRGAKNFTRWHLEDSDAPGKTLCMRRIPEGTVTQRPTPMHDCLGCWAVYEHERAKQLEAANG